MKTIKSKNKLRFKRKSTCVDRRRIDSRRKIYSLDYFAKGGLERRKKTDRRMGQNDRRKGWVRVSRWSSIFADSDAEIENDSA